MTSKFKNFPNIICNSDGNFQTFIYASESNAWLLPYNKCRIIKLKCPPWELVEFSIQFK